MRSFKAIYCDENTKKDIECGRYCGAKPKQAACKALSKILKDVNKGSEVKFKLAETTEGSRKKIYHYSGERHELDSPITLEINDANNNIKTVSYKFSNVVKKITASEYSGKTFDTLE